MVEQVPQRDPRLRRRAPRPGRHAAHERPVPERRAPERREPDRAGLRRRRAARLRREPRAPRRRRRRRAGEHRRVPRGLPGGRDHPAGAGSSAAGGSSTTSSGSCSRRSAPSTRPPATSARRSRRTTPACGASRRWSSGTGATTLVATMDELLAYTERRTLAELAALPHGVYEAEGVVDNDGYTDEPVRLQVARRAAARRRALRHDRLRPAAPRAGQLDLRDDLLGVRLRAQVPDRSRPAGQRRLLPADRRRRARGHGRRTRAGRPRSSAAGRRTTGSSR